VFVVDKSRVVLKKLAQFLKFLLAEDQAAHVFQHVWSRAIGRLLAFGNASKGRLCSRRPFSGRQRAQPRKAGALVKAQVAAESFEAPAMLSPQSLRGVRWQW